MAKGGKAGDWLLIEELFERGDPSFIDALRRFDDAETLATFAPRWLGDRRPEARRLMFEYLERPLNAFRHEGLVKRVFKLAEAAGDDELMARLLVAFDRSIRRIQSRRSHREVREFDDEPAASAQAASWRDQGYVSVSVWRNWQAKYQAWGSWIEPIVIVPSGTGMPRGKPTRTDWVNPKSRRYESVLVPDWVVKLKLVAADFLSGEPVPESRRKALERYRLFSIATRNYLRRRAWRYFRRLGRRHPERYLAAVRQALVQYRDADVSDGLALIDNWGLIHILFHFSPALVSDDRGWRVAEGRSLAELEPAPAHARLWMASPRAQVDLLLQARCRAVRSWAVRMIRRDMAAAARVFSLEERLSLLADDDPDVVSLVGDLLRDDPGLKDLPVERWLRLLDNASPAALEILCERMERLVAPERVSLAEAVGLALARPLPVARLGLRWLMAKLPRTEDEFRAILGLVEARCDPVRPELVRWARGVLSQSEGFQQAWVLDWLDSRHEDVRAEGWEWFRSEPRVRDDVTLWQRLMETPYDDVRLALVRALDEWSRGGASPRVERRDLDAEQLRLLWASVLLNVHRGNRAKPLVVRQLLRRVEGRPDDLPRLLPLLAIALRSVRGPEWRAGLSAVVRLVERDPASLGLIHQAFPELQIV